MTGLDPEKDRIIEVGAIATDWRLREVARYAATVKISPAIEKRWLRDKFWLSRQDERDKLRAQIAAKGKPPRQVEDELLEFLDKNFAKVKDLPKSEQKKLREKKFGDREMTEAELADFGESLAPIYLAGNSVHQDQKFIEREMPRLNAKLHYRQLDVSAWKIIMENRRVRFIKPEAHRAMSDIEGSIAELKFYLKKVNWYRK